MAAQLVKTKKKTELCRICCNIIGNKNYDVKKYTDSIENYFYININIDNNALHPEDMCQRCYLLMHSSMKRKTTIKLTPFDEWDPHTNCHICNKVKLLQKRIIGAKKLKTQKGPLGKPITSTINWSKAALESLKEITLPDLLSKKLTLKDFAPDINPHLHLCVCVICENLLKKPLIFKSCQHVFCFLCLSSFLNSKPEDSTYIIIHINIHITFIYII